MRSRCLRAIALEILPCIAIGAIDVCLAFGGGIVLFNDISNDLDNLVRTNAYAPPKVLDCVVNAFLPSMTDTLHSVATDCADTGSLITRAHVYRICSVTEVEAASECPLLLE